MTRKILIVLLILIGLATAAVYAMTRPRVLCFIIKSAVNANARATDFKVKDLIFEKIRVDSGRMATIEGVIFKVLREKNEWRGEIPAVHFEYSPASFSSQRKMTVGFDGARVRGKDEELKDAALKAVIVFPRRQWQITGGHIRVGSLTAKGIAVTEIDARVRGDRGVLTAEPWSARWAGGILAGGLTVKKDGFKIRMDTRGVDLSAMGETIFGKMRGRLEGTIELQGTAKDIGVFKGHLNAPAGAEMRAAVLSLLLPYIPASAQKNSLERLIAQDSNVFFDQADMNAENIRDDALQLHVMLASKKLNLDIDVIVDVNMEGGFKNALERFYQSIPRREHGF